MGGGEGQGEGRFLIGHITETEQTFCLMGVQGARDRFVAGHILEINTNLLSIWSIGGLCVNLGLRNVKPYS